MKKRLMAGLLAGIMTISLAMPATAAVKAEKITIKGKNTVTVGKTIELDSVITPKKAKVKDRNIIWRSSDSSIAKVLETKDDDTKIKGIKAGTATITVKIKGTSIKNTLKEKIKKLTLASSASARKTQYCTYEQKIDAIDKKLDKLDDKWEKQWKAGKISRTKYKTLEKKREAAEDYLETVEDYLDKKFNYEFDD